MKTFGIKAVAEKSKESGQISVKNVCGLNVEGQNDVQTVGQTFGDYFHLLVNVVEWMKNKVGKRLKIQKKKAS